MEESTGLINKIIPPRLEDAGLEDCALPPDSIKEAFFKAASAVKSRATSIFTDDQDEEDASCVQDPWPDREAEDSDVYGGPSPESSVPDSLVGVEGGTDAAPGSCVVVKGGGVVEEGKDKVVVVGGDDVEEREKEKECVNEGLKGLKIGEEKKKKGENNDVEEEEEGDGEEPKLTEGYFV